MSGRTVIVDYGSGNLHSAEKSFARAARDVGGEVIVSADAAVVAAADRIVLPGVGAFGDCAAGLSAVPGMVAALTERVIEQGAPFFGICVGMQLMADLGRERGVFDGLGWIGGEVTAIDPGGSGVKIPHMGWNALDLTGPHPVLAGLRTGDHAYFVHSFALRASNPAHVLASAEHGERFPAMVGRDAMIGSQFHPEKSQGVGLRLIENFLRWRP